MFIFFYALPIAVIPAPHFVSG